MLLSRLTSFMGCEKLYAQENKRIKQKLPDMFSNIILDSSNHHYDRQVAQ